MLDEGRLHDMLQNDLVAPLRQTAEMVAQSLGATLNSPTKPELSVDVENDPNFANVTMSRRRKPEADDEEAKQLLHDITASLKRSKITADADRDERNSNYLRILIGTSCVGIFLSFKEWDDNGVDLRTRTAQCLVPFSFLTEFLVDNMGTVELVSLVPNLRILLKVVRMEKVKQFIESGEEIDPISQAVKPVLLLAAEYSEWGIVSAIFERKIAFNSIDKPKFSRKILTYICQSCSTPLVRSFIHSPINMGLNFTEAILLAYESQRPDVIDFILSLELHFDVRLYDFRLAIEVAVSYLDVEFLKFLHERGVEGTRLVHSVEIDEVQNFLQACFDLATIPVPEEELVFPYDSSTVLVSFIPACIEGLIRHSRSPLTCINLLMKEPAFEIDDANLQINVLPQPSFAYLFAQLMRHPLYDATILKRLLQLWVATKHASRRVEEEREDLLNFCKVIEDVVVALFACDATNREENLLPLIRMEKLDDSDDILHSLEVGHLSDHLNQQRIIRIRRQNARSTHSSPTTRKKLTGRRLLQASLAEKLQARDMRWIFGEESFIKLALDKKFKVAFGIPQINRLILLIFDSGRFEHQESYFQERFFPQILFYIDMLMRIITFILIASIAIVEYPKKMRLSYSAPTKYVSFTGTEVFLALFLFAEIIHEIGEVLELRQELVIRDRTTGVKVSRGKGSSGGQGGGGGWTRRGRAATLMSSVSMSSASLPSSLSFDDSSTAVDRGGNNRRRSTDGGDEDENGHRKDGGGGGGGDIDEELLLYDGDDVTSGRRSFSAVDGLRDLSQSLQEHLPLSFTEPSALSSSKPPATPTSPTAAAAGSTALSHNATALLAAASAGPPLPSSPPMSPSSAGIRSPTAPTPSPGTPAAASSPTSPPSSSSSSYYAPPSRPRHHHRRQRRLRRKRELFQAYFRDDWNIVDVLNSTGGLVWFVLRCIPSQFIAARVTLSLLAIPWSIGLLRFFSVNKTLGELVIIIRAMLQDLTAFVSVYIVMIAGFGVAFRGLFADTTAYATMSDTFLALFSGTLSNFSFESFETGNRGVNSIGILLTLVFVVMTAILLINLLIAKMSTSFQRVSDKSQMEWAFERAKLVRSLTLIREKDVWNILPAPLNLIPIVFTCGGVADYNVFQRRTLLAYQRQWLSIPARWLLPATTGSANGEGEGNPTLDAAADNTATRTATRATAAGTTSTTGTGAGTRHASPDDDAANVNATDDDGFFLLSIRGTIANITLFFVYFPLAKILEVCLAFAYAFVLLGRDESGTHPPGSLLNLSPKEFIIFFAQTVFYLIIYVPLFVVEMLRSLTKAEWMLRPWVSYLHDVDQHLVSYTEKFLLIEAAYVRQRYEAAAMASAAVTAAGSGTKAGAAMSPSSPSAAAAAAIASDDAVGGSGGDDDNASPHSSGSRNSKKRQSLSRRRQLPGRKRSAYDATTGGGGGTGLTSSSFFTRSAYSLVKDTYALYPPGWDGMPFLDDALDDGDETVGGGGAGGGGGGSGDDGHSVGGGGSVGGASMASGSSAAAKHLRGGRRMSREFSLRRRGGDDDARDDDDDLDGDLDADEDEVYHQHKRRHLSYRNRYRQLQQQLQQQQLQQQQQQQGRPLSIDRRSDSTGNAAVVASIGGARDSASMDDASHVGDGAGTAEEGGAGGSGVGAAMGGGANAGDDPDGDVVTLTRIFRDEDIDVILRPFACSSANSSAMSGGYGSGGGGSGGGGGMGGGGGGAGGGATMPAAMAVNQQVMLLLLEEHNDRVQALQAALATALAEQRQLRVVNHEMHTMLRTLLPVTAPAQSPLPISTTTAAAAVPGTAPMVSGVSAPAAPTTLSATSNVTTASSGNGNGNVPVASTPATLPASQPPALTTPVDSESVYAHPLMSTLERMGASLRQLNPSEPAAAIGGAGPSAMTDSNSNPIDFSFLRPRAMSLKLAARLSNVHTHATGLAAAATAAAVSSAAAATSAAAAATAAFGGIGSNSSGGSGSGNGHGHSSAGPMPPLHGRSRPPMPPPPKPLRRPRQPPLGGGHGDPNSSSSPPPLGHPPQRK